MKNGKTITNNLKIQMTIETMFKYCLALIVIVWHSIFAKQPNEFIKSSDDIEIIEKTLNTNINKVHNQSSNTNFDSAQLFKNFITDFAQIELLEVFIFTAAAIIHETGHAIAAKTLFDVPDPIQIHIGEKGTETIPELFSFGNLHFHKALPWKKGHARWNKIGIKQGRKAYQKIDDGIMRAAGGLSASLFMYILLSTTTGYCAYCDNKELSEIIFKSFINALDPFSYILNTKALSLESKRFLLNMTLVLCLTLIHHIFYGCTPFRGGDGLFLWKNDMGIKGTPLKIAHVLSTLGAWGCWVLLIKKYCDARKKLFPLDSRTSLPIALSSLLLMYNQLIPKPV